MTPDDDILHFLVTRDAEGQTTVEEFGTDYDAAQLAYQHAEQQASADLDVVLLSADSLDTIKRTHSSYFQLKSLDDLLPA
jgi:hypothetical protein